MKAAYSDVERSMEDATEASKTSKRGMKETSKGAELKATVAKAIAFLVLWYTNSRHVYNV